MNLDYVIKILFIEDSVEEAEQIISLLRNSGIAVRPARATTLAEIHAALEELRPDLILLDPNLSGVEAREVAHLLDAQGSDQALIALLQRLDERQVVELFAAGIRGIGLRNQPRHLLAIVQREFVALQARRQVRRLETSLRETERRCEALLDSSTDAIAYVHEGMHVRANPAYLQAFGFSSFDDILGLPVLDLISSADADTFKALLKNLSRGEKSSARLETQARRADGVSFKAMAEFAHATFEGEPCLQIVFRRQPLEPIMVEQLQRDSATGLYNRQRTLEVIDEAIAAASQGQKSQVLLLIEPDNWTDVVGRIGLGNADRLLAQFSTRIIAQLTGTDTAGLLADHMLALVLRGHSDDQLKALVEALRETIARNIFDLGTQSVALTASLGGSLLGEKNANSELLLSQASGTLRNAQSLGGNRSELHDPAAREKADAEREQYWLQLLRQALERDAFVLYHQQIISLQEAEGDCSEVLLRLEGPQGEVLPGFFLPIADKHGLMPQIDRWVLGHAIDALRAREGYAGETIFFVKLTASSLHDSELLPWLAARLQTAALKRGRIVLEMPESKVMTTLRPAQDFVNAWKALGGQFALEQFGSGLNSFQLLTHIDADYLKIDRSFMADLPQHPENQKRIAEICRGAHDLKRLTVAEWVEDAASTSLLFACGVDFVQGNFLQQPQRLTLAGAGNASHAA
jgi:diguanylate cyclase (GGDEF)-like protein/PAS domain S-box-containing protein